MTITRIEEFGKNRNKIYIEGGPTFVLYRGELRMLDIHEGEEISEAAYARIFNEILPKRARLRVLNLLKSREYTSYELKKKLRDGYYPENIIDEAVGYAADYRYIDDLRYAVDYITSHEASRSRRRIEHDLMNRGITPDMLEHAWLIWEEKGGIQDEQGMIKRLLEKRHYDPQTDDIREKRRTYAFLIRKGFNDDAVRRAMKATL